MAFTVDRERGDRRERPHQHRRRGINMAQRVMDCGDAGTFSSPSTWRMTDAIPAMGPRLARPWVTARSSTASGSTWSIFTLSRWAIPSAGEVSPDCWGTAAAPVKTTRMPWHEVVVVRAVALLDRCWRLLFPANGRTTQTASTQVLLPRVPEKSDAGPSRLNTSDANEKATTRSSPEGVQDRALDPPGEGSPT
jgi:hypothetical protein